MVSGMTVPPEVRAIINVLATEHWHASVMPMAWRREADQDWFKVDDTKGTGTCLTREEDGVVIWMAYRLWH